MLQFVDIRAHTGGEHQHDDAQFTELGNEIRFRQHVEACGAQDQASQQGAHHLGHLEPLGQQAQQLGAHQDQGKIQQIMI